MPIDKKTIEHIAHLARIELKNQELEKFFLQLEDILGFLDKLKQVKVTDIAPTSHILPINNVLREDSPKESLPFKKAIMNAPRHEGSFFAVPKVIE